MGHERYLAKYSAVDDHQDHECRDILVVLYMYIGLENTTYRI
jgi:hypothetical protein